MSFMAGDPNNPNPQPDPKPPTPPADPKPPAQPNPPANPQNPPQQPAKPDAPAVLTLDDVSKLLADHTAKWEAERVPQLRKEITESITAPLRRDGKVRALRQELQAAGKYKPADDDATDPLSPGDLAALLDLDDSKPVHKDKDGREFTKLDVELARTRARLMKRDAKRTGRDDLPTPATGDGDGGMVADLDKIRKDVAEREKKAAEQRHVPLHSIFGGMPALSTR